MNRNKISKLSKLLLILLSFAFSTSVLASCCLNPYSIGLFCMSNEYISTVCCTGPTSGFEDQTKTYNVNGAQLNAQQAQQACPTVWIKDSCDIPECDLGCCVGKTITCESAERARCLFSDLSSRFYPFKTCQDPTVTNTPPNDCALGCCCDDITIKEKNLCSSNFILGATDCATACANKYPQCQYTRCEGSQIGCNCGGDITNASKPFCCALEINTKTYASAASCISNTACAIPQNYSISGTVKDTNGVLITDVRINVTVGTIKLATTSTITGYKFDKNQGNGFPSGSFVTLTASKQGFNSETTTIHITNKDEIKDIVLTINSSCGDGNPDYGLGEKCDKGELNGKGYGCTIYCTQENECGNKVTEPARGEQCDDGNTISGDGCSANCLIESICGNANKASSSYISMTNNPWKTANEECDDGNIIAGDGCSPLCMLESTRCTPGEPPRTKSCASTFQQQSKTGSDGFIYTYKCPTQENCTSTGYWSGGCEKIDPNCPTICEATGTGRTYCPDAKPICTGTIYTPDIIETNFLGRTCCESITLCKAQSEIAVCEDTSCGTANTSCLCGGKYTTPTSPYCCYNYGENNIYGTNTGTTGCYKKSNSCKPTCPVTQGQEYMSITQFYTSNGYGCICDNEIHQAGYCCSDGTFTENSEDCAHVKGFITISGRVTDSITGLPINSTEIILYGTSQTTFSYRILTDLNGEYKFKSVPPSNESNHTIIAGKRRIYRTQTISKNITQSTTIDFSLEPLPKYRVRGTVFKAEDNTTVQAAVFLDSITIPATTTANGNYDFNPGDWVLEGTHVFKATSIGLVSQKIRVYVNQSITGQNFSLTEGDCFLGKYLGNPDLGSYEIFQDWTTSQDFTAIAVTNVTTINKILATNITWKSSCPSEQFNIYRCEGTRTECSQTGIQEGKWNYITSVSSKINNFYDLDTKPNTNYCYRIGVEYETPFIAEVISPLISDNQCITTGDTECIINKQMTSFCKNGNLYSCTPENKLNETICQGRCAPTGSKTAACFTATSLDCSKCNKEFWIFHKIGTTSIGTYSARTCDKIPSCYEDYSETTIDQYYDCSNVSTCYDYKSQKACQQDPNIKAVSSQTANHIVGDYNNKCLPRNCTWETDPRYTKYGFGTCRERLLNESCPGDSDCDGLIDRKIINTTGGYIDFGTNNYIGLITAEGTKNYTIEYYNGSTYNNLTTSEDNVAYVGINTRRIRLNGIDNPITSSTFYSDPDSDNDYSPDIYDYDPYTINSIMQNCSRCNTDSTTNKLFKICDKQRCALYGQCYFANGKCISKNDANCGTYTSQTDCQTDVLRFGACNWNTSTSKCIKDSNNDGTEDCTGTECLKDFTPPLTRIPHLKTYNSIDTRSLLKFYHYTQDEYTNSYTDLGGKIAKYYQINNLGYNNTESPLVILIGDDRINTSNNYTYSYYSTNQNMGPEEEYNNETQKSFQFEIDNTPPQYIYQEYDPSILSDNPDKKYYDYTYQDPEERTIKKFSYLVDAYTDTQDHYLSDLIVNFTLDESAVCKIKLVDIDQVSKPENVESDNRNWTYGRYGPDFQLKWEDLEDGEYNLYFTCYDKVLNELKRIEHISIQSDQSVLVVTPSLELNSVKGTTGIYRFNTTLIDITVKTKNPYDCKLLQPDQTYTPEGGILTLNQATITNQDYKVIHTAQYLATYNPENPYNHLKIGCKSALRDNATYKYIDFFIDKQPPPTTFQNLIEEQEYNPNIWYSTLALAIQCKDPEIRNSSLIGEFGCDNVKWCIGNNCEPTQHDDGYGDETTDIITETLNTNRALDICYISTDKGTNTENNGIKKCQIIKIDKIPPIIDDATFIPRETNRNYTTLSGEIGNYLSNTEDYTTLTLSNNDEWNSGIDLDEFDFKFNLKIGEINTSNKNIFDLATFRGNYKLKLDIAQKKIELKRGNTVLNTINYEFKPGQNYEFRITGTNTLSTPVTTTIKVYINDKEIPKINYQDRSSNVILTGNFSIPKAESNIEGIEMIQREVSKIRLGNSQRVSPISDVTITVNEGEGTNQRVYPLGATSIINQKIELTKEGNNSVKICATDSALPPKTGCGTFYAYKDHVGPVITANINALMETTTESIAYESPQENYNTYAQYGYPLNFSIYVEDEEWTNAVGQLILELKNSSNTQVFYNLTNNPETNLTITLNQDPKCIQDMNCTLPEGTYELILTAYDRLGNHNEKTYYFEIRDTIAPTFNITMSDPDGIPGYALPPYTYEVNITSSEPISQTTTPEISILVGGREIALQNKNIFDNYTYKAELRVEKHGQFQGLDDAEAEFQITGYDRQETPGTEILSGKTFRIDTTGYTPPQVYYPLTDVYAGKESQGKILITGLEGDEEEGRNITVKATHNSSNYAYLTESDWQAESSTTSLPQPTPYTTPGQIIGTALAEQNTVEIIPDYSFGTTYKYIDFATHNRKTRMLYKIINYEEISQDRARLTLQQPLEKDANGTFTGYTVPYPKKGMFILNATLAIGANYIYTFSLDERKVLSEPAEQIILAYYDQYNPIITPITPWQNNLPPGQDHLVTSEKRPIIQAKITENITSINTDTINLNINYAPRTTATTNTINCNTTTCEKCTTEGCTEDTEGTFTITQTADNKNATITYTPTTDLEDAVYTITLTAKDLAENTGTNPQWTFEVDQNAPHDPIANTTQGKIFNGTLYTATQTKEMQIIFIGDQGKFVNVSNMQLAILDATGNYIIIPNNITFEWTNNNIDLYNISTNYTTTYKATLNDNITQDNTYYIITNASKLYSANNTDPANPTLNFSDWRIVQATIVIDTTPPQINITMQTPTMLYAPHIKIETDDPSTCIFNTDEQQISQNTTFNQIGKEFETTLAEHSFAYTNIGSTATPIYIQNKNYYTGTHTVNITCTNILGVPNTTTYTFSIIPPNRDKVYYQEGDTIEIKYKIGITGLGANNFNINFSETGLAADKIPVLVSGPTENPEGQYTITYTLPGTDYATGHYKVNSKVTYNGKILTDIPLYLPIHNLTWTVDDFTNIFSCINKIAGTYFDERDCNFDVDIIHAKDRKLNNAYERDCFNSIDDDYKQAALYPDGKTDALDTDCQATYYQIRSNTTGLNFAINYSDPQTNGVGRICLVGGTDGTCSPAELSSGNVQIYYTSRVQPGGDLKIKAYATKAQNSEAFLVIGNISQSINLDSPSVQISSQQLTSTETKSPTNCETDPAVYCDTVVFKGPLSGVGFNELATIKLPISGLADKYPGINVKTTVSTEGVEKGPIQMQDLEIGTQYDTSQESYYTEGGLSVWCNDSIDNDLDSGKMPMQTPASTLDPTGFDCRDTDCQGKDVSRFTGMYRGTYYNVTQQCQATETICNDAFDNDYSKDFSSTSYDFDPNTGIDCRDPKCNGQQGHPTNPNIKCEYLKELNCSDGFDNNALNKMDCEMDVVTGNPTPANAEYDCANYCRTIYSTTEQGAQCTDGLDNNWDAIIADYSGTMPVYKQNMTGGVDCRYTVDGINNRPDPSCNGQTIIETDTTPGKTGSTGTGICQLGKELSCSDSFDNNQDGNVASVSKAGWSKDITAYNNYFAQFGMHYSQGADCDSYDCASKEHCPTNESQNPSWCFDGIDNNLNGPIDCADPDCNNIVNPANPTQKCEYPTELTCNDNFDNNGNNLIDAQDPNCTTGMCYPNPEHENVTIDSCSDTFDNDNDVARGGGPDCADSDCIGKVCALNSKCLSTSPNGCKPITQEICGDLIDNNGDNKIDCEDTNCKTQPTCIQTGYAQTTKLNYPNSISELIPNSFFTVQYSNYIHQYKNSMGQDDGWITIKFTGTGVPAGTIDLQVGTDANPLTQITDSISNIQKSGANAAQFTLISQGTSILARYAGYTGGNTPVELILKIKATTNEGTYNIPLSATSAVSGGTGGPDKNIIRQVQVLENTEPTIEELNYYSTADKLQLIATTTDTSNIAYCRFKKSTETTWSAEESDCITIITGLSNAAGPISIDVESVDGKGNKQTRTFEGINLKNLKEETQPTFLEKSYNFFEQNEKMTIKQEFTVPTGQGFPDDAQCTAQIYDENHHATGTQIPLSLIINQDKGVCQGVIDLKSLNNNSVYSVGVQIQALGETLNTTEKQFFVCKYTQFPSDSKFTGYHCMDSCQIDKVIGEYHVCDNGQDGYCVLGCNPIDPDCGQKQNSTCNAGDGCTGENCATPDPDCGGATCAAGDGCLTNCEDPDCQGHTCDNGQDGFCVKGCSPIDPNCGGPLCGNGNLEFGEECDDGNTISGDGCSASCTQENVPPPCPEGFTLCANNMCSINCIITDGGTTCNNDGKCDANEGCDCPDCKNTQDTCETGLTCDLVSKACCNTQSDGTCNKYCATTDPDCNQGTCGDGTTNYGEECDDGKSNGATNSGCTKSCKLKIVPPPCPEGLTLCADNTCSMNCQITDTGTNCNNNGQCETGEGCTCQDCNTYSDTCGLSLTCDSVSQACCNTASDGTCNPTCASVDPDCGPTCAKGDGCAGGNCPTPDPDCDGTTCAKGDGCLTNCPTPDPDCGTGDLFIGITKPQSGTTVYYPKLNITGITIDQPGTKVDIFVNTLTESQYQAQVGQGGVFEASAILLSQEQNTIIARVAKDGLVAEDSIDVNFNGVDTDITVNVDGLPDNINSITINIQVKQKEYTLDLDNTEVTLNKENGQEISFTRTNTQPTKIVLIPTPSQPLTKGIYKVAILPIMKPVNGETRYGVGKLYMFSYCPGGSKITYKPIPPSKTKLSTFTAQGTMYPAPQSAEFKFITPNGYIQTQQIEFDNTTGEFNIELPNILNEDGKNYVYYIITEPGADQCQDISRTILYDTSFAGLETPYIKGETTQAPTTTQKPTTTQYYLIADSKLDFTTATQGTNNWNYYKSQPGTNQYTPLINNTANNYWVAANPYVSNDLFEGKTSTYPGTTNDAVRAWTSSINGEISITATIADKDNSGGDGINYTILKNQEQLYTKNYENGFAQTAITVNTTVTQGDNIYFRINKQHSNYNDETNETIQINQITLT